MIVYRLWFTANWWQHSSECCHQLAVNAACNSCGELPVNQTLDWAGRLCRRLWAQPQSTRSRLSAVCCRAVPERIPCTKTSIHKLSLSSLCHVISTSKVSHHSTTLGSIQSAFHSFGLIRPLPMQKNPLNLAHIIWGVNNSHTLQAC